MRYFAGRDLDWALVIIAILEGLGRGRPRE